VGEGDAMAARWDWTLAALDHEDARRAHYALWITADGTRGTVTTYDLARGQVTDAMPGDRPRDGGSYYARICDSGIEYVSHPYSVGYARRMYRRLVAARREEN
jgi:hypothetical protein